MLIFPKQYDVLNWNSGLILGIPQANKNNIYFTKEKVVWSDSEVQSVKQNFIFIWHFTFTKPFPIQGQTWTKQQKYLIIIYIDKLHENISL